MSGAPNPRPRRSTGRAGDCRGIRSQIGPWILAHLRLVATLGFGILPTAPALADSGITDLGSPGAERQQASGVSADGNVVVGFATFAVSSADEQRLVDRSFLWTPVGGMVSLGVLNGGTMSQAYGVTGDGTMVVGVAGDGAASNASRAFRWTQETGMVSLGVLNGGAGPRLTASPPMATWS